ncbi:cyclin-dependent protein kinase inhibitor SMR6-like [Rhodamnia argentea]|uniref:Cyclin-dependent protein kinase inhibitor SMR6-like n=1 Tax=Rhodamnia argentea TaxID=178133 RepID=A0A8B8P7X6_9MYRT|nr:cyclin-dependent protein kinase inhibitor SMR6-like [Rhodamnia argentea]
MGVSKKPQVDSGSSESEIKKWVVSGAVVKAMKPISTKARSRDGGEGDEADADAARSTTPTAREARIPEKLPCPPAPRKRRPPSSSCHMLTGAREFFNPPDLETVFKRHVERAK